MPLWEEYAVVDPNDALRWIGREQTKLLYLLEVQAGLERTVVFHHDVTGIEQPVPMLFDWTAVRRYVDPEIQLVFGTEERASHPIYAIVPSQRSIVRLDVHATAEIPQADGVELLARYLREIEALMPSVSADRQGEAQKHLRSLIRIVRPA
jgi:hypothetical protein